MLCKGIEFTLGLPTTAAKWTCVKKIAQRHTLLAAAQMSYRAGNTVVRPERFELPASWFVGSHSITRKPMIPNSSHYSNRLIFPQDMSP